MGPNLAQRWKFSIESLLMQNFANMLIMFQMRMRNKNGLGRLDSNRILMGFFASVWFWLFFI